jgi:hypothetical protein
MGCVVLLSLKKAAYLIVSERAEDASHSAGPRSSDVLLYVRDSETGFVTVRDAIEEGARAGHRDLFS